MDGWTAFWILYAYAGLCVMFMGLSTFRGSMIQGNVVVDWILGAVVGALWPLFLGLIVVGGVRR